MRFGSLNTYLLHLQLCWQQQDRMIVDVLSTLITNTEYDHQNAGLFAHQNLCLVEYFHCVCYRTD